MNGLLVAYFSSSQASLILAASVAALTNRLQRD
jgi:hypothetical protein